MRLYLLILWIIISFSFLSHAFDAQKCEPMNTKVCVDHSERTIQGHKVNRCWKYQQMFKCVGREINYCQILEDNRGCNEISGQCLENTSLGLCKHFEKKFVCGNTVDNEQDARLVDTQYDILKDEKSLENCKEHEINKYCEVAEETCLEGPETRNINGKEVYKDCWKWDRKYICKTDSYVDECSEFKDRCKEVGRECLHEEDGRCEHYEVKYQCDEQIVIESKCLSTKFCLGGICDTQKRNSFSDFASSISYLSILANMKNTDLEGCKCSNGKDKCDASEIDPANCKFFRGDNHTCRKFTGQFNCCTNKGSLRSVFGCKQAEKDLAVKKKAGLCHHVGTWKGKGLNRFKNYRSHCCFKSKLARIIQVGGRAQLGIGWGNKKSPDCRGLTINEIQRIDFSKIDFSELFAEVQEKTINMVKAKSDEFKNKIEGLQSNPAQMSQIINKKISSFYDNTKR